MNVTPLKTPIVCPKCGSNEHFQISIQNDHTVRLVCGCEYKFEVNTINLEPTTQLPLIAANFFCKDCTQFFPSKLDGYGKCKDPDATWGTTPKGKRGVWAHNRCNFEDIQQHFNPIEKDQPLHLEEPWLNYDKQPVLFVKQLQQAHFSNAQITEILKLIDNTCHECWDNERRCQCSNDE